MTDHSSAATFQRASLLHQQGRLSEAEELYRVVLSHDEAHVPARHQLGVLHMQRGDLQGAVALFHQAIDYDTGYADAHNNLGTALIALGRINEAGGHFRRALELKPDFVEAQNNLGNLLRIQRRYDEAIEYLQKALVLKPDYPEAHRNLGLSLHALGKHSEAIAHLKLAAARNPGKAEVYNDLGSALVSAQRSEEAIDQFKQGLLLKPDLAEAHNNIGQILHETCQYPEAMAAYDRALAIRPDYAAAQCNQALTRLTIGDFAAGWLQYEWRWLNQGLNLPKRNFPRPVWLGSWNVRGKSILLHGEQGLGDTLQFVRYASLVEQLGARVVLVVQPPLIALLKGIPGVSALHAQGEALPAFDCHCPLMSLPLAFGTTADNVPAIIPYLRANPEKVSQWHSQIAQYREPRIGLVWSGSKLHRNDGTRSIPLSQLVPLLDLPDLRFFSLQKELREADAATLKHTGRIVPLGERLEDFADTAAVVSLLDVVITVDTAVAHLAAALGKPVWILLAFSADWRWLRERLDSPWYPTARLFRQSVAGDWPSVVEEVKKALSELHADVQRSRSES